MNTKNDIGKAIKERLNDAQVTPSDGLWDRIDATMEKKRRKRRGLFWLFFIGVLALGGISTFAFLSNTSEEIKQTNKVVDTTNAQRDTTAETTLTEDSNGSSNKLISEEEDERDENITEQISNAENYLQTETSSNQSKSQKISQSKSNNHDTETLNGKQNVIRSSTSNEKDNNDEKKSSTTNSENRESSNIGIGSNTAESNSNTNEQLEKPLIKEGTVDSLAQVNKSILPDTQKTKEEDKTLKKERFKWSAYAFGLASRSLPFDESSYLDTRLQDSTKTGVTTYGYQVGMSMNFNEHAMLSLGVGQSQYEYLNNNILAGNRESRQLILNYRALDVDLNISEERIAAFLDGEGLTSVGQKFQYIDIPVFATYQIGNGRLGPQISGGLNVKILTDNIVFLEKSNGEQLRLGEANNLNAFLFGANVGIGGYYKFSDKLSVEAMPILDYNINVQDNGALDGDAMSLKFLIGLRYHL